MREMQTGEDPPAPRYDAGAVDPKSGAVHADVVELVGSSRRVLELGSATGYTSKALADRGCEVVGVAGDLDALDLEAELGGERFDAIVAAGVLEHLKDPLGLIRRLRPFLEPAGCFVISVPNVAHGSVRLALLAGNFDYQSIGLLDSNQLRFFTLRSLEQLLDDAELGLADLRRHELDLTASEVRFDAAEIDPGLREQLEADVEARTYRYVAKAIPMEREGLREIQRRLRELPELRMAAARLAELEKSFAEISGREGELRKALIDAHDQLLRREAEMQTHEETRDAEVEVLLGEIEVLREEAARLHLRLDQILSSRPRRIYAALRRLPGVRRVSRRREASFDAAVAERSEQSP